MKISIPNYSSKKKTSIKIDSWDTWNCDRTIALIVFPMLVQLKQNKQGIPIEFSQVGGELHDSQQSFDFYYDTYDESFQLGVDEWNKVLDKIIWSFYQLGFDDNLEKYDNGVSNIEFVGNLLVERNPDYWHDFVGSKLHEDRIQEGLDLFGKYFRSLWD